jgi:hypothetical protein
MATGTTAKVKLGCGRNFYVTLNERNGDQVPELLVKQGKPGQCVRSFLEAMTEVANLALEKGATRDEVGEGLMGHRCPMPGFMNGTELLSCADAMGQVLCSGSSQMEMFG